MLVELCIAGFIQIIRDHDDQLRSLHLQNSARALDRLEMDATSWCQEIQDHMSSEAQVVPEPMEEP